MKYKLIIWLLGLYLVLLYCLKSCPMITKQQIPFVRILLFFVLGIFVADYFRLFYIQLLLVIPILASLFVVLFTKRWSIYYRWVPGVLLMISMFLLGYANYMMHSPARQIDYIGVHNDEAQYILVEVKENPKSGKRLRCIAESYGILDNLNIVHPVSGKILLYIDSTKLRYDIGIGDKMLINTKIYPVRANSNPHVFDYKNYLYYRDVNLQAYIDTKDILNLESSTSFSLYLATQKWREKFYDIIVEYIPDKDQQAIAAAMLLGIKNNLDADLYESFTNSGAVHVLAVSGLHVGFVAGVLFMMMRLIPFRFKYIKGIKTILIVAGVFIYGLMTGMAPAIMRATIMYAIFIVARAWRPATSNYNLLAFSAFIMLLYNPFMLFQASFQFSYLAILGIMVFYYPINRLIYFKHWLLSYSYNMISVSIAAQLMVFPITVYYFHKFPTYFFISGLIAIPAAAIIISLGIGLVFFHYLIPSLSKIIALLLQATLKLLIAGIGWINKWPMSNIDGIFINKTMMVTIYVIIIFSAFYYFVKSKTSLFYALIGIIFFIMAHMTHTFSYEDNYDFIVYDSFGNSVTDIYISDYVYSVHAVDMSSKNLKFLTYNHRLHKSINKQVVIGQDTIYKDGVINYQNGFLEVGKKLFYFSKEEDIPHFDTPQDIDYLVIGSPSRKRIETYLEEFNPRHIIIDHSSNNKQLWKWKNEVKISGVKVHFTDIDGVFEGEL